MMAAITSLTRGRAAGLAAAVAAVTLAGCSSTSVEATRLSLPETVPAVPAGAEMGAAHSAFEAGNFGYAARYYEQAGQGIEACLGLAASYDWLYRFDLADRAYERCAAIGASGFAYHNNRGFSYLLRGDTERAALSFGRAQAMRPDHPVIRTNLRILRDATPK